MKGTFYPNTSLQISLVRPFDGQLKRHIMTSITMTFLITRFLQCETQATLTWHLTYILHMHKSQQLQCTHHPGDQIFEVLLICRRIAGGEQPLKHIPTLLATKMLDGRVRLKASNPQFRDCRHCYPLKDPCRQPHTDTNHSLCFHLVVRESGPR